MINNENTEILNKKMEQPTGSQPTTIKTNPRKSFIAFLFSLLFPGLGQIYNGQPRKASFFSGYYFLYRCYLVQLVGLPFSMDSVRCMQSILHFESISLSTE